MSQRNPISQTKHDRRVKREARNYQGRRYSVEADIPGYPQPRTIGGYRPDVIAIKGTYVSIVEVETPDSVGTSHAQAQDNAFRRAARRHLNWHSRRVVTN